MFSRSLKEMRKDTDEQPNEEWHGAGSGSVPSTGGSVPTGVDVVVDLEALRTQHYWDFHRGTIDY